MTLTHKQTLTAIRKTGASVRYSSEYGEYRVNVPGGTEGTAYYTDDRADAIGTAKVMMQRYHSLRKPKGRIGIFGA